MTVRAKMKCISKEVNAEGATIRLEPVISGSAENERFYKWTPGGCCILSTINLDAAAQFEIGNEYYVDLSPAS